MQAPPGMNCVLAASSFGPTDFCTDLLDRHASHPASALTLGESGDSHPPPPTHLRDPHICNGGLCGVVKRITSHGAVFNYLLPGGEYISQQRGSTVSLTQGKNFPNGLGAPYPCHQTPVLNASELCPGSGDGADEAQWQSHTFLDHAGVHSE